MGCCTADNSTNCDDCIILSALCQLVGDDRNLESTRNPYCGDVVILHAMAHQAVHCSIQELLDNNLVETGSYNSNLHSLRSN